MRFNNIGDEQINHIQDQVKNIVQVLDNQEAFDKHMAQLNSDCVICYHVLETVSKESLDSTKRLESWKLNNINKDILGQNQVIRQEIRRVRKDVYITSERFGNWAILLIVFKWIFIILLAPLLILPWVIRDPYKYEYCDNHFHIRPIKKEQIIRWSIYVLLVGLWLGFILFLRFM